MRSRWKLSALLLALAAIDLLTAGSAAAEPNGELAPTATLRVDLQKTTRPVSPALYGIFLEEISHAFDGGLYAELIQNRNFSEGIVPPGMKLIKKKDGALKMELDRLPPGVAREKWDMPWPWMMNCGWDPKRELIGWSLENAGANGRMKLTEANPRNAASPRSLEITVAPAGKGQGDVSLVNQGYWGIAVQAKASYALKIILRPGTFAGRLTAVLRGKDGHELARHDFGDVRPSDAWQTLTAALQAAGADPEARLSLDFHGRGTLQVGWVSLFPPTYKNRPNGLRIDLARYLDELKPAFIRYPGGCYVEGLSFESAPDWRNMVCPPEQRPGQWGYWQYRSTDGFGYHEFLEFCEDIGASAMYVTFAGMTVHPENNWPLDKIDPVIEQTLDAIEYALGPVESKWGAVRAKMGHPRPFPLKYVEIGNEHPPALYGDYYAKFRKAIRARYPQMQVVMSMYWSGLNWGAIERAGDRNIDIVDEHAYRPSNWARSNFDYFDKYARKPWKIYIGEYAHHHASGDWSAAMDDSLMAMMMERNGDLVTMASYAPLLANVHAKCWGVNLIEFDASRSFAHSSYYVQKTFNENRPDENLAMTLYLRPQPDASRPLMAGKFGLGSWHTGTEFKELRMYDEQGKLVFSDDFHDLSHWEAPIVGKWQTADGILRQTELEASPSMLLLKSPELTTGRVTLKARRVAGTEGFLMFFNASGIDRFLFCNYGAAGNQFSAIQDRGEPEGVAFHGGQSTLEPIKKERWYEISLRLTRDKAEMYLDGKRVSDAQAEYLPSLFATAGYDRKQKSVVIKATNYHAHPVTAEIHLDGASQLAATGRHVVIRSEKPTDENSLESPRRIVPQEQPPVKVASHFSIVLPPCSVNVLRIGAERPESTSGQPVKKPAIVAINPPEKGFFSKRLDYEDIPIKAHKDVADAALYQAQSRLAMMLDKLPAARQRMQKAGAELHIIGRNQVTSDLPEFRSMKGKPFDGNETIDERTRGMGGLLTSCGEENLLKLPGDRYPGRDICVHEFSHNLQDIGLTAPVRAKIRQQYERSLAQGRWKGAYAAGNEHEFFAELSMWYWGTHGDLGMQGEKPAVGREGLRKYDAEAFALLDDIYGGKFESPSAVVEHIRN